MIRNPGLSHRIDVLSKRRKELVIEKQKLERAIKALGITKNRAYSASQSIDDRTLFFRDKNVKRKMEVDREITAINEEVSEIHRKQAIEKDVSVGKILREIFSEEQFIEINKEARLRLTPGYEPQKMSFSIGEFKEVKEKMYAYRKIAQEHMEKMIQFRIELTGLIEKGCTQFGDGEFLKFISPLNQLVIPVNELRKIKLKHNL